MISSLVVAVGSIYAARKLVLTSAAKTGTVCLAIAAAFCGSFLLREESILMTGLSLS